MSQRKVLAMNDYSILILSPSNSFSQQAEKVMERLGDQFKILQAAGPEAVAQVRQWTAEYEVKVIVSRGYNVKLMREHFAIPVVDVRYTFEDVYYSYETAARISKQIAFIAVDTVSRKAETFGAITKEALLIPKLSSPEQIPSCIRELSAQGVEVFIGGQTTERTARELNLISIDIAVEESSMEAALVEAKHLVNLVKEKRKSQTFIESILEAADSCMIAVSADSEMLYKNRKARRFFGDALPEFITSVLVDFVTAYQQTESNLSNQVIEFRGEKFILNFSAITANAEVEGYLASLERLESLQAKEGDVRNKLSQKINTAKKSFDDLVGSSPVLSDTIRQARKYADSDSVVLINGETGTGKEIFAQGIHNHSPRREEPFIAINCAALSESVLESELFGYVKGAFTGAVMNGKTGLFEAAHKGTIFLDEIGDVSLNFQAKLLRVLQEKEVTRIGDTKSIPVDVRIISATNRNLVEMVALKEFREDLYYRLCVLHLKLPPLRQRQGDIDELVRHLLAQYPRKVKISAAALELLAGYQYPGNIRQLQNIVERLVALCENDRIDQGLVQGILETEPQLNQTREIRQELAIAAGEKELIERALLKFNGNKTLAAAALGIGKTTLWRKLKLYNLE